ncbi:MAG: tetratricopeptide repeat protein [Pirellulales bacterium]|nr:tetratricopeptide repeat protein [Pirellulales bacterium]
MLKKVAFLVVGVATLACVAAAAAESPSDLLEKGIYTEETVGDLDKAIEIYQKIISQAEDNRAFVAQAQLRLGKCLLKQGKQQDGEAALRKLVNQFKDAPDQKELVAKARELLPSELVDMQLDPVPWVDGEYLELRIKLGGRLDIGDFILSARLGEVGGREVWHLGLNRNIAVNSPNLGLSQVVADRQTFRPIRSEFRHSLLGNVAADYEPGKVTIRSKGNDGEESVKKFDLDGVYYDNEQGWHLFRRLPLADDYKRQMPICATFGTGPIKLDVEVTGKETVEVPAGRFECYKLLVKPVQQTFWVSTDAHRYVVKFEAGGVSGVLQSIRQVKPGATVEYADKDSGFSVSAPADWYFIPDKVSVKEPVKLAVLVDPAAESVSALQVEPLEELADEQKQSVRVWAEHEIEGSKKTYQNFEVVADSWQQRTVAGYPAVSCLANYEQGDLKTAKYHVFVLGKTTASRFVARVARERMDDFRRAYDKIIDTYKVE